jgi:tyrosine-specific transport protein
MKMIKNKVVGSALLIAGTQIGAGMLALPISTGATGFFNALLLFICSFLFMLVSLFLLLEANLFSKKKETNLISMVRERLGAAGQLVAWFSFLFLLYAVAAAYLSAGGALINAAIIKVTGLSVGDSFGVWLFLLVFGFLVVFGTKGIDWVNRICVIGLFVCFSSLVFFVTPKVNVSNFSEGNTRYLWATIPVVILSFTSHIIVPSLKTYLGGNIKNLKKALLWGSIIPLIFYLLWEFLIFGLLPMTGKYGLAQIATATHPVSALTEALHQYLKVTWIPLIVGLFSFFALLTSFFGVSLSLYDFLADGFRIKKTAGGKTVLLSAMFIVPLFFALFFPQGFLIALGYAGVFVAILYGILPPIMVWHGRYIEKKQEHFKVFGGKPLLILMITGSIFIICIQIAVTKGWLPIAATV